MSPFVRLTSYKPKFHILHRTIHTIAPTAAVLVNKEAHGFTTIAIFLFSSAHQIASACTLNVFDLSDISKHVALVKLPYFINETIHFYLQKYERLQHAFSMLQNRNVFITQIPLPNIWQQKPFTSNGNDSLYWVKCK